jgi:hypothetical protein
MQRRKRRPKSSVLLTLVTLAILGSAIDSPGAKGAAGDTSSKCLPKDARSLLRTPAGVVFQVGKGSTPQVYACLFSRNRPQKLQLPPSAGRSVLTSFANYRIQPPWIGYSWKTTIVDSGASGVAVLNLQSGRIRRAAVSFSNSSVRDVSYVTDVELKSDGSIAWISEGTKPAPPPETPFTHQVEVSDKGGYRVLETSPEIGLKSLSLKGSELTWIAGSDTRSAAVR